MVYNKGSPIPSVISVPNEFKCFGQNFLLTPFGTNTEIRTLMHLTLAGLPPPQVIHTYTQHTTPDDPHRWVSEVKVLPPKRGKTRSARVSILLQPLIILASAIAYQSEVVENIIWHITHNHDLTGYVYRAKVSRVNFPFKSLDLDFRHIILNMTKSVYQPQVIVGRKYDSRSVLMSFIRPKSPLTNEDIWNILPNLTH